MAVPAKTRIVIIGGGIIGCSIAYHLAKLSEGNVVLLERLQLTHGATWHAAGLVGQLRSSSNLTRLMRYSAELGCWFVGVPPQRYSRSPSAVQVDPPT